MSKRILTDKEESVISFISTDIIRSKYYNTNIYAVIIPDDAKFEGL